LRFSIAAMKIALLDETRHFCNSCMLVLTNCARTEFSSTIMLFGSKRKLEDEGLCERSEVGWEAFELRVVDLAVDNREEDFPGDLDSSMNNYYYCYYS